MKRHRFKNLRAALRWRRHHRKQRVTGVTVISNPPIKPQASTALTPAQRVAAYCHHALSFAGEMVYTESALRSQLFHRAPGDFKGAHADCSQFCASILHWVGCKKVNDTDYTGTLLDKGTSLKNPQVGCVVIFGPGTGTHAAFISDRDSRGVWYCTGFGHQGAPDRVSLTAMKAYFQKEGRPGVRYLGFV